MKYWLSLIVLICSFSSMAEFSNTILGGEFRLRNDNKDLSYSVNDKRNTTQMRARLLVSSNLSEKLKVYIAPQATKNFGEVIAAANDENSTAISSSGDKYGAPVNHLI